MRSRIQAAEKMRGRNKQEPAAVARVLIFLLLCAAMTLGLGPRQLAKLKPLAANTTMDARKPDAHQRQSGNEFLNTLGLALPKPYSRLINTAAPVNTFTVTTTADNGSNTSPTPGSLREAIINANNSGGEINFNIPASDPNCNAITHVCTITTITRSLPDIIAPVTIDGYTQPGASANTLADGDNAVLLIELNGNGVSGLTGLWIDTANCTVRGLVINGFNGYGIGLYESAATNTHIEGSFIGTNALGTAAIGNSTGIYFQRANGNQIGGTDPAARNVISGNLNNGILIENGGGAAGVGNIIQGNYVGTNAAGTAAIPNQAGIGIVINSGQNNLIGGTAVGAGNLVSGNLNQGIRFASSFPAASFNAVQGNLIGTDISGTAPLGNGSWGVDITTVAGGPTATSNVIGGATAAARNIISANAAGVRVGGDNNTAQGNFIGVGTDGIAVLGNHGDGIFVNGNLNHVGGGNVIAYSGTPGQNDRGRGVFVYDGSGNTINGNSIFSNGNPGFPLSDRGIALGTVAIPANDGCDADGGANNSQNYPVLASATFDGATTTIEGTLNSSPNTQFRIEFFANDACHLSGFGEGKTFLGAGVVTTDGNCTADFTGTNA
ncbi:MAG TPA: hypothetical protein VGJ55_14735, partial [Pyrinomonadaceae bacterium]